MLLASVPSVVVAVPPVVVGVVGCCPRPFVSVFVILAARGRMERPARRLDLGLQAAYIEYFSIFLRYGEISPQLRSGGCSRVDHI